MIKSGFKFGALVIILFVLLLVLTANCFAHSTDQRLLAKMAGAWVIVPDQSGAMDYSVMRQDDESLLIISGDRYVLAYYNSRDKRFIHAEGGVIATKGKNIQLVPSFLLEESPLEPIQGEFEVMASGKKFSLLSIDKGHWEKKAKYTFSRLDDPGKNKPLSGVWECTGFSVSESPGQFQDTHYHYYKFLTGKYWMFVRFSKQSPYLLNCQGGVYLIDGNRYEEHFAFFMSDDAMLTGDFYGFTWRLEDNTWYHKGVNNPERFKDVFIDERWVKLK
jgi:hypothetical protein